MGRTLCGRSWTLADRRSSVLQQGAATVKSEPERMNCIMPLASARDSIEPCCPQFTRMCRLCPSRKIITGRRHGGVAAVPGGLPLQLAHPLFQRRVGLTQPQPESDQLLARQLLQPGHSARSSHLAANSSHPTRRRSKYLPECLRSTVCDHHSV